MNRKQQNITVLVVLSIVLVALFSTSNPLGQSLRYAFPLIPSKNITIAEAQAVFEEYRSHAEKNDLDGLRSVSYQLGTACRDVTRREECNGLMSNVAILLKEYEMDKLTHILGDGKQAIIYSDWMSRDDAFFRIKYRYEFYVVRDGNKVKFLYVALPYNNILLEKGNKSNAQLNQEFTLYTDDTDMDGLGDAYESTTDSHVRDSDGDGWWDGIEVYFR